MRPGKVFDEFKTKDGRPAMLRALARSDLEQMMKFAQTLVRERKTNPDLGIISLDRRVTRAGEREFIRSILLGMAKKEAVSVAAFVQGRLVGNCQVTRRRPHDIRHTGALGIAILERYRGIGLGERMVRTAMSESKKIGIWLVELQVFEINTTAKRLYEKVGFKPVGVVPGKMQRGGRLLDEMHMYADLRVTDKSLKRAGSAN